MNFPLYFDYFVLQVSVLDDSIGNVVNALKENQMLDNSVILFFCDNGATIEIEHSNGGSNSPFRGVRTLSGALNTENFHFVFNKTAKAITMGRRCAISWSHLEPAIRK